MFLGWWAKTSMEASARELDALGPRGLLHSHRMNLRVEPAEVVESRLEPPRLLGHGDHFACWSLSLRERKQFSFQIEDVGSLKTALEHLPRLLGPALSVTVAWDDSSGRSVRVSEAPSGKCRDA
jgi:hypothetical protein